MRFSGMTSMLQNMTDKTHNDALTSPKMMSRKKKRKIDLPTRYARHEHVDEDRDPQKKKKQRTRQQRKLRRPITVCARIRPASATSPPSASVASIPNYSIVQLTSPSTLQLAQAEVSSAFFDETVFPIYCACTSKMTGTMLFPARYTPALHTSKAPM